MFMSRIWRIQPMDVKNKGQQEMKRNQTQQAQKTFQNYIQPFTYLFNKKKFKKLLEQREWDYEINLTENTPKKLNAKTYTITIKEDEVLNQWLNEQLKTGLIVKSSLRYIAPYFYIPKKEQIIMVGIELQEIESTYN